MNNAVLPYRYVSKGCRRNGKQFRPCQTAPFLIIIITFLLKEDDILSASTNLTYDPPKTLLNEHIFRVYPVWPDLCVLLFRIITVTSYTLSLVAKIVASTTLLVKCAYMCHKCFEKLIYTNKFTSKMILKMSN